MKNTRYNTKQFIGYIIIATILGVPSFAFAKDAKDNTIGNGEHGRNRLSSQITRSNGETSNNGGEIKNNILNTNLSQTSTSNSVNSNLISTGRNSSSRSQSNLMRGDDNNKSEDEDDDRGNNLQKCFRRLSKLTIADILNFNFPTTTTLTQICLGTATSTDTISPVIANIVITPNINGAVITWATNEQADSSVFFSTTTPANVSSGSSVQSDTTRVMNHSITLTALSSATMFNVVIKSTDASGNTSLSNTLTFTTLSTTDTTPPVINSITPTIGTSTVQVAINTNEASNIKVFFSTTTPVNTSSSSTSFVQSAGFGTVSNVMISGLIPNTAYSIVVVATDPSGNNTISSTIPVTTSVLPVADITPPTLSSIFANSASSSINISWTTNELATSKIYFSTTTPVSTTTLSFVENVSLFKNHILLIPGLIANTLYHLIIQSKDAAGNIVNSFEFPIATTPAI
ncbi:MAG: hypothetical protein WCK60_02070 [Candidatus Nomurabacteria bacterium]